MTRTRIRLAIAGASGRMGRHLIQAAQKSEEVVLVAALSREESNLGCIDVGNLAGIGRLGVTLSDSLEKLRDDFDILIDFTHPESTLKYLNFCVAQNKAMVIGTTGFNNDNKRVIMDAAKHIGIVLSSNFSIGINLVLQLLKKAAKVIGDSSDIEIIEAHHRYKVDAPSGTALAMGEVIANSLGRDLKNCAIYTRVGHAQNNHLKSIGFSTLRAGDIVGEHTAMFVNAGERIEITHKASNRMTFAVGAIRAASWLYQHKQGMFNMNDVLNLD